MRLTASFVLFALCLGMAERAAAADATVVVLGLRSLEGDDEFANALSEQLRASAKGVTGWKLLERAVSMAQMTLSHNCEDIDAGCLSEIARGLESERLVFGTVRRTAARSKYDYEVTVSLFNGTTHTIAGTETRTIDRNDGKQKKVLGRHAQELIAKLAAADASAGRLTVEVNVLSAEVRLDGQLVGQAHDGRIAVDTVTPGEHTLEVTAIGHQTHTQRINVNSGDQSTINVTLERNAEPVEVATSTEIVTPTSPVATDNGSSLSWLGYSLIGVGAASAIAWGASMYMIEFNYNQNKTYQGYVQHYRNQTQDACDEALKNNNANDSLSPAELSDFQGRCRTGRTFQTLQWVFLGVAVVSAGVGTYVLITDSSSPDQAQARLRQRRFTLEPMVDRRTLAVQATLHF
jgi:hypothetical protein